MRQNTKNFKNLPKTLTQRHQSGVRADFIPLLADASPYDHPLFQKDLVYNKGGRELENQERDDAKRCITRFYPLIENDLRNPIFRVASITVHGTFYKRDQNTVLLADVSDSNPVFGSLSTMFVILLFFWA